MPLIKGKSEKAFKKNVETEMKANPGKENRAQNLAIAYAVKRKAARKAKGGQISGEEVDRRNMENAGDESELKPLEHPLMEGKVRSPSEEQYMADRHIEDMNSGGKVRKKMADGGSIMGKGATESTPSTSVSVDEDEEENHREQAMLKENYEHERPRMMADGGFLDEENDEHNPHVRSPYRYNNNNPDIHVGYADGGEIGNPKLEMSEAELPDNEERSIAHEILRKRHERIKAARGGRMMADGGEVDLQKNSNEDLNNEDQMSYQAARKKTYYDLSQLDGQPEDSNEHDDDIVSDDHDMVDEIRRKIKMKRGM